MSSPYSCQESPTSAQRPSPFFARPTSKAKKFTIRSSSFSMLTSSRKDTENLESKTASQDCNKNPKSIKRQNTFSDSKKYSSDSKFFSPRLTFARSSKRIVELYESTFRQTKSTSSNFTSSSKSIIKTNAKNVETKESDEIQNESEITSQLQFYSKEENFSSIAKEYVNNSSNEISIVDNASLNCDSYLSMQSAVPMKNFMDNNYNDDDNSSIESDDEALIARFKSLINAQDFDENDNIFVDINTSNLISDIVTTEDSNEKYVNAKFDPYFFIKCLPPYDKIKIDNKLCLPVISVSNEDKLCLVLDLDETLVHCSMEAIENADYSFPVYVDGFTYHVNVKKRPNLELFLNSVSTLFEVVVFTASQRAYADKLLDLIDPERKLISYRLFRESCLFVEGNYLKDLNVLGRDLRKCVLVDNSPFAYGYQLDNGIPIESWFDDESDIELLETLQFLKQLIGEDDVRPVIREQFKSYERVNQSNHF